MKKFLSCLVSVGVLASTVTAFAASSAFNPNKDPNGDGQITMADSVTILDYLAGIFEPSDLTQLDMDDNDVVSNVDEIYVRMYNAGLVNSSIEPLVEPASELPTTSRSYRVYNAQTGTYLRNYSLSVTDLRDSTNTNIADIGNSNNTRDIIGDNTQSPDWSNIGVAKIMSYGSMYDYLGTGFVIGPHTIATAAHVVFETANGYDCVRDIDEVLLFDETGSATSFTPVECHIPTLFVQGTSPTNANDYAIITVEEDLSDYISFNLGYTTNNAATNDLSITIVGFPDYLNISNENQTNHQKALSEGTLTNCTPYVFNHNADVEDGNSGSPIYVVETINGKTYNTVVGIHLTGIPLTNTGVRFNSHILKFFKGNTNTQY